MAVILQETQRAVFYAPFYVAFALDTCRMEGVDVVFRESSRPDDAVRNVTAGSVDLSWGGPMRVIVAYDRDPASELVCFCEVVTRDPFMLIGRTPRPNFQFDDLRAVRLGVVSEVPTPWCCLQEDLRRAGIDAAKLNVDAGRTMAENANALRSGGADVVQVFEPFARQLLSEGLGHVWHRAAIRGHTSYTCFYTRRPVLEQRRAEFLAMTRAIYRAQTWVNAATDAEVAATIGRYFSHIGQRQLTMMIAGYRQDGVWGKTPSLPESGFERLKASLLTAKLVTRAPRFEDAVDNVLAEEAIASATFARGNESG